MTYATKSEDKRAQHFRAAALLYIDDAYTLAHFLLPDQADAEDAVQECYALAQRRFDGDRSPAMKTWLLAILRNLCHERLARSGQRKIPEYQQDGAAIRELVVALPLPFREAIALHEFNGMSYREIAEVIGESVGTVMSRLARARAMLLVAWMATDGSARWRPTTQSREAVRDVGVCQ
jgi:RNA polymerase sigma-70 factor (ECF subfamily)